MGKCETKIQEYRCDLSAGQSSLIHIMLKILEICAFLSTPNLIYAWVSMKMLYPSRKLQELRVPMKIKVKLSQWF